jgi:hypothetical protein
MELLSGDESSFEWFPRNPSCEEWRRSQLISKPNFESVKAFDDVGVSTENNCFVLCLFVWRDCRFGSDYEGRYASGVSCETRRIRSGADTWFSKTASKHPIYLRQDGNLHALHHIILKIALSPSPQRPYL